MQEKLRTHDKMQTNAFSHKTKNTQSKKCGGKNLMVSIGDRLRERSDASPHQKFFNAGLNPNSKKTSKKPRNNSRTAYRKAKKMARDYMINAKSIVEYSQSYVKVYDKERPHMLQTMTPMTGNRHNPKKMKSKSFTVMPAVAGAHLDHPIQFISE